MRLLSELLTNEERQGIRAPIETARTFPRCAFVDQDFYQFELEHVLRESWMAVSFGALIPNPGDLFPLTVLDLPIFLIRGEDRKVRAFHNVCPYDGCEVTLRAQHGVESIVTPYHGWQYSLAGKLEAANYWDGTPTTVSDSLKYLNADLVEIPTEEWLCTIFIYPGNHPDRFVEANHAVIDHLSNLDLQRLQIGLGDGDKPLIDTLEIKSNWKTVYENYSPNVYHESFVHAMYRASPHSPRVDRGGNKTYTEINDPSGYLGLCYDNSIGASFYGESVLPKIRNKDGSSNGINTISNVFPNWVTTILENAARISIFLPEGPECGTQIVATIFDRDGATDPQLTEQRLDSARKGIVARKEDNIICESIQRARHSPAIDSQFYCPFWDAMHYTLSNLVLDKLELAEQRLSE